MLMFWSGLGFLVPTILVVQIGVIAVLTSTLTGREDYFDQHRWLLVLGFALSGLIVWLLGEYLAKKQGRVVIDKATGEEFELKPKHHFFFIPMRYWGAILPVVGVLTVALS